jgi:NodT family efflux transporter outer membrane factor (OMF) lipoprotein
MGTRAYDASLTRALGRLASLKVFGTGHLLLAVGILAVTSGCTGLGRWMHQGFKVGPDYCPPPAPVADNWIDYENPDVASVPTDYSCWWGVFGDPVLDQLIDTASRQNLTLQTAGMRILEARARLAVARGNLLPQIQQAYGDLAAVNTSATVANPRPVLDYDNWGTGFNASWEIDFWGRFRRAIEAEDALLNAEIENYDNVLVVLQAEVAAAYIQYRTLQQRLELAKENAKLQERSKKIAEAQFLEGEGKGTELDVAQAKENLAATESFIPEFERGIRQTGNAICVLLGVPPRDLADELGDGPIPGVPAEVMVGIPAELLRRRPDVRRAERLAAAQSAIIGVAESDFYPRIAVTGFIGFESENLATLFDQASLAGSIGPGFQWNILNYGRILNNVRANEARFHQLVLDYQNTVLAASQEVEDGIISFLKERERAVKLAESATHAKRSVDISTLLYRNGKVDFLPVVYMQQILTARQDELATSQGRVAENVVAIYKALGGGWQTRMMGAGMPVEVDPFVDEPPVELLPPPEGSGGDPPAEAAPPQDPPAEATVP